MPTKKKRVVFIPREDVMKLIDKLSIENNLSNSKIISILVEEALSVRGIFNQKTGKVNQSYINNKDESKVWSAESADSKDNVKSTINTKVGNYINPDKTKLSKQINQDSFDLQTYKRFISFLRFQEMINEFND